MQNQAPIHQSASNIGHGRDASGHVGPNGERKQHSTKIANALKKYIHEIEATTTQISHMTGGNGSRGYAHESTSRTGRDSHRARSSNQAPKRSNTAGKVGKDANGSSLHGGAQGRHSTTHSNAHDSRSYHHRTDRESHQTSAGYPNNAGGYVNPHMPGTSTSKQAPRAHSSKHLGGTSTSRTTAGGGFASDHALVHAQSNHLN